jgi:hypothetical protein
MDDFQLSDIWCLLKYISYLAEQNKGLGGWVGAIGSILAVIFAWLISRAEYMRTIKRENINKNQTIDLIVEAINRYHKIVGGFDRTAYDYVSYWKGYSSDTINQAMDDLANTNFTSWPSLDCFLLFRKYHNCATNMIECANLMMTKREGITMQCKECEGYYNALMDALERARP